MGDDFSVLITEFLKSPLAIAIVTVLGVKIVDFISERTKASDGAKQTDKTTLWGRIDRLEAELSKVNEKNDQLVTDNAKLNARVSFLEAQNEVQAKQLAKVEQERSDLQHRFETDHETLNTARQRIGQLIAYVRVLEERLRKYEQVSSELPTLE